MTPKPTLVIGANGFLGSHVTRQLVTGGAAVRVMVRPGANTVGIDDLQVTRFLGDIFDTVTLREAMDGCDVVYYCVVDTRAWLRDPAPLFHTNVEGLRGVLDVAKDAGLKRFVFTSSYATVGRRRRHRATEDDIIDPRGLSNYVRSRVQAEEMVLRYAAEMGLPAVAMCVSSTYGTGDWGQTPHGAIIAGAAFGKLPFVMSGIALEAVGVQDAARAMILAAEHGRNGERYLISEKMITNAEVARIAADEAGVPPPGRSIPLPVTYALGALGNLKARLQGTDERLTLESVRLMRAEAEVDHSKASRELGWDPSPVEESIRAAARFWVALRAAKRKARAGAAPVATEGAGAAPVATEGAGAAPVAQQD
jgi:dihydroflavonol-4-reductase